MGAPFAFSLVRLWLAAAALPDHEARLDQHLLGFDRRIMQHFEQHLHQALADRFERLVNGRQRRGNVLGGGDVVKARHRHIPPHDDSVDRKSTRLNSSHVRISYAVFCLKKKKTKKKKEKTTPTQNT